MASARSGKKSKPVEELVPRRFDLDLKSTNGGTARTCNSEKLSAFLAIRLTA
jgi:hypothetical protein